MATVFVNDEYLSDIADAIRTKKSVSTRYTPAEMAEAINSIPSGGITPTGTIEIMANGTYNVTNYASAHVDVPTGGGGITDVTVVYNDWVNKGITSSSGGVSTNANRCLLPHFLYKYKSMYVPSQYKYAIFSITRPDMTSNGLGPTATYNGGWTGTAWAKSLTWHDGGVMVDFTAISNWADYAFYVILRNAASDSAISTTAGESVEFVYNLNDHPWVL